MLKLEKCYSTTGGFGLKYLEALCNSVSSPKADHKLRVVRLVYKDGKKTDLPKWKARQIESLLLHSACTIYCFAHFYTIVTRYFKT